jgi:hypothetical protein
MAAESSAEVTMHLASFILSGLSCFLCVASVSGNEKERQWQTGKVLDTSRTSVYAGEIGSVNGSSTASGNTTYGSANGSSTAVYKVYETYTIEAADYIYVCQEHIRWRWSKPAALTVNGPVKFAIEKEHLYIKGEDGSEHETKIIKKAAKPQHSSATETPPQPERTALTSTAAATQLSPTGTITVNSNPDGADIYVDDSFVGNAASVLKLSEGKHSVRVSMTGYKNWSRDISVLAGSEVKLVATLEKVNAE